MSTASGLIYHVYGYPSSELALLILQGDFNILIVSKMGHGHPPIGWCLDSESLTQHLAKKAMII